MSLSSRGPLLTIGEAAKHLNMSVDHLRKLTNEGVIPAVRTTGNQRRYRRQDLDRYIAQLGRSVPPVAARSAPRPVKPARPVPQPISFEEAFDDPFELAPAPPPPPSPAEAQRLLELRRYGMNQIPWDVPAVWRQKVQAELDQYVTVQRFPPGTWSVDAWTHISARVREVLREYDEEVEKKQQLTRERESRERQRNGLIQHGMNWARSLTASDWETEDQEEFLSDIRELLEEEVRADWTWDRVAQLVKSELARWEEVDEDDDEDADEDEGHEER